MNKMPVSLKHLNDLLLSDGFFKNFRENHCLEEGSSGCSGNV